MSLEVMEKAKTVLHRAYARPGEAVLDDLIDKLLEILLAFLDGCTLSATQTLEMARSGHRRDERNSKILLRRTVRRQLRDRHGWGGYRRHGGPRIVEALYNSGRDEAVTAEDIAELMTLAQT